MNLAQQKLDRNFEWCCMFKKTYKSKAMSCIGMKDLGRVFGCVERFYFVTNNGWTFCVPEMFFI